MIESLPGALEAERRALEWLGARMSGEARGQF
jgi:hypothetical protein